MSKWENPPDAVWVWGKYGAYREAYCHAEEIKQEEFEIPVTKYVRADLYAALETQNAMLLQNMRDMKAAFEVMRNDLNELFPIQSAEADLMEGPEMSVACAAIVTAACEKYAALDAQLAEANAENARLVKDLDRKHEAYCIAHDQATENGQHLSALEATPPAPAVTEAQIEAAARNIASLYGSPDECVQGSGGSGTSGVSFQCQKRAWENYVAHARAALQAIEVKP